MSLSKITAVTGLNNYDGNALSLGDVYNYTFVLGNPEEELESMYMHITPRHFAGGDIIAVGQTLMARQLAAYTITNEDWIEVKDNLRGILGSGDQIFPIESAVQEVIKNGGKLPCEFCAVPEGTVLSAGNPIVIVKSTYAPYMIAFFEAVFQRIWYMTAVASRTNQFLTIVDEALRQSVDDDMIEIIRGSRIHGFGFRSTPTDEAGIKGGLAAILAGLKGTDDFASVLLAKQLMGAIDPANSVPAAAHLEMMSLGNGVDNQIQVMQNKLEYYSKMPFVSFPIDTSGDPGAREIITRFCSPGALRDAHLKSDMTLVFRPDSAALGLDGSKLGHADTVVTYMQLAEKCLSDLTTAGQGMTKNKKGYKLFPKGFAFIYGDSVNPADTKQIFDKIHEHGFSLQNLVIGVGGNMLQKGIERGWQDVSAKISQITFINKNTGERIVRDVCKTAIGKVSFQGQIKVIVRGGKIITVPIDDGPEPCIMVCYYKCDKSGITLRQDTVEQVRAVVKSYRGF